MKCKNILIFSFLKGDAGDSEINGGAASLEAKQRKRIVAGSAKGIEVKTITHPIATDNYFADYEPLSQYEEKDDVGVYMICHAAPNSMTPSAVDLAKAMWSKLFLKGIDVKKMNLLACMSAGKAGGKVVDLDPSHLTNFCKELLRLDQELPQAERKLPNGLKVCGYAQWVTIVTRTSSVEDPEVKQWKTHGSVQANPQRRNEEEEWEKYGDDHRKVFIGYGQQNTISTTHPKGDELLKASQQLAELEGAPAAKKQRISQITNAQNRKALNALWGYLRCKRALQYDRDQKKFKFCSMSEYTQNAELGALIKRLETYVNPCEAQKDYVVRLPPAAAPAAAAAVVEGSVEAVFAMTALNEGV